jgi:hypothetical protein
MSNQPAEIQGPPTAQSIAAHVELVAQIRATATLTRAADKEESQ